MNDILVSEVMTKDPVAITFDVSLEKVLDTMIFNRIRRVPVVDNKNRVIGIISDRDLRLVIDSPLLKIHPKEKLKHLAGHRAQEIMCTFVHTVEENLSVIKAAKKMRFAKVGSLPVLDENKRLVGILTRSDIINHLIRISEPEKKKAENLVEI